MRIRRQYLQREAGSCWRNVALRAVPLILISAAGCTKTEPVPPNHGGAANRSTESTSTNDESAANSPDDSVEQSARTNADNSLPAQHAATDPIDLTPAIVETKDIFRRHGLPDNWYATLSNGDGLYLAAVWKMVMPDVATAFQSRFQTRRKPASTMGPKGPISENIVFEELALRALRGDSHDAHVQFARQHRTSDKPLPNVNSDFLEDDGGVAFAKLKDALIVRIKEGKVFEVDAQASTFDNRTEWCRVVGSWKSPTDAPDWAAQQLQWRPIIRVEFAKGERVQANTITKGERRLIMGSYVQIGFRRTASEPIKSIFLAGPFKETNYQPVGEARGAELAYTMQPRYRECPGQVVYGQLESLNRPLDEGEKEAAVADSRAPGEIPDLNMAATSAFSAIMVKIHADLHSIVHAPAATDNAAASAPDRDPVEQDCEAAEVLNFAAAVKEAKSVFRQHGLPVDWFADLVADPAVSEPLFVTGLWTMVAPDVATRFQQRYETQRKPFSRLSTMVIDDRITAVVKTDSPAFEELVLLSLMGPDHQHVMLRNVHAPQLASLPGIDERFLSDDGGVDFTAVKKALVERLTKGPPRQRMDARLSRSSDRTEYCEIICPWRGPRKPAPTWVDNQVSWRFLFRVEFVKGERVTPARKTHGDRRLVLSSYVQIGYRSNRSDGFEPVHLAGPFNESNYQPTGTAHVMISGWDQRVLVSDCKKQFTSADLSSLNAAPDPTITASPNLPARKVTAADRPDLTSVADSALGEDVDRLHRLLHDVLSPGNDPIPR